MGCEAPTPSPTGAPGTVLLTCDSANGGGLPSNWRRVSLRAGPLWFAYGRQFGYVHYGSSPNVGLTVTRRGKVRLGMMIVEVTDGSTVVMNVAPAARSYFHFLAGFGPGVGYKLGNGATGYTFISCPPGTAGPNGQVTDFYLGFAIEAGSRAPVEIWRSPSARPILVTFTCPGRGCEG